MRKVIVFISCFIIAFGFPYLTSPVSLLTSHVSHLTSHVLRLTSHISRPFAFAAQPDFPPIKGEYYPVEGQKYPQKMTNPYSFTRTVDFSGDPIEIYTQINMVTQIQIPSPPVMVNVGRPEGFVVEVVPEFNSIFVKPIKEIEMTNMIVTTEKGVYTFILKENPFKPWDIRVMVTNPYRNVKVEDTYTLVWTAYYGKRPAEFQFLPLDIRSPNASNYIYDPVVQMGCNVELRRVVFFPRQGLATYWVRVMNVAPPDVLVPVQSLAIDERSVWTDGLVKVAVPGTQNSSVPLLGKGDSIDMFLIVKTGSVPPLLRLRLSLKGARLSQAETLLTTAESGLQPRKTPEDEKLQRMYQDMLKKENIETVNPKDIGEENEKDQQEEQQIPVVPEEIVLPQ